MSSRFLSLLAAAAAVACGPARAATTMRELRVCADPNNMPFSNQQQQGFENRIAELVAREMDAKLSYVWYAQRRGFTRNTINAGKCDVYIGVPTSLDRLSATIPYYRSTYVFATRQDRNIKLASFDDPALRKLTIGVQLIGDDFTNTPPAHALTARNIVRNVKGYSVYADYREPNPPARIIDAVAKGDIDVAIAWGPLAGYFAKHEPVAIDITPVSPQIDLPFLPMVFDISMGVRRGKDSLRDQLNAIITRRKPEIDAILDSYGVPRLAVGQVGSQS
ncbi:MAG TPA: substrate-binding domain-containing protein [Gemmatimonadaceae bacterium]|jgi:mxaJ protein|nr:substrate-binding domain-containing protein [Gemmatimonadaceae bacterium]